MKNRVKNLSLIIVICSSTLADSMQQRITPPRDIVDIEAGAAQAQPQSAVALKTDIKKDLTQYQFQALKKMTEGTQTLNRINQTWETLTPAQRRAIALRSSDHYTKQYRTQNRPLVKIGFILFALGSLIKSGYSDSTLTSIGIAEKKLDDNRNTLIFLGVFGFYKYFFPHGIMAYMLRHGDKATEDQYAKFISRCLLAIAPIFASGYSDTLFSSLGLKIVSGPLTSAARFGLGSFGLQTTQNYLIPRGSKFERVKKSVFNCFLLIIAALLASGYSDLGLSYIGATDEQTATGGKWLALLTILDLAKEFNVTDMLQHPHRD